ncbi:hypothetical protein F5I97DRAFT_1876407 [Phlebopus sp. FC_14]|nr:hypothetical protein F5I97DRAFT_1876407 [Phlebopus sp. FC_14]
MATKNFSSDHFAMTNQKHIMPQGQSPAMVQWNNMIPQNQQFNPMSVTSWQSQQMQSQSVPHSVAQTHAQGYAAIPHLPHNGQSFDLSSILPPHIVQDFLRLSTPVGQSPNDDTILAQALYDSRQQGKTYRQALEGLHGVNNHAANLWKDYYLDHHDRFDIFVSRLAEKPKTVKKPFAQGTSPLRDQADAPSSQTVHKRDISPPSPLHTSKRKARSSPSILSSQRKRAAPSTYTSSSSTAGRPSKRPRSTMNSLSAPLLIPDNPSLLPPQADIRLPKPPSRSPTPPTKVQNGTNGNRYTKEDRDYFINLISWRLKQDPSLTKKQLCEQLYEKAPHHSATSWASHWHQRHDIADKILASAHQDYDVEDNEEEDGTEPEAQSEFPHKSPQSDNEAFLDWSDADADTVEDEAGMGEPGLAFTHGDWCILARFMARNQWDKMSSQARWDGFTTTYATKRTGKAWAEFYRKNEKALLKLAERYGSKQGLRSFRSQRRRPSWAKIRDDPRSLSVHDRGSDEDADYETDNGDER